MSSQLLTSCGWRPEELTCCADAPCAPFVPQYTQLCLLLLQSKSLLD
jgi:hypothetical protein